MACAGKPSPRDRAGIGLGLIVCLAIGVCLAAAAGCDDDDGSGLGLQPVCVTFVPDEDPAPGTVVARPGAGSTCEIAEVELIATGVENVLGASFTIEYNPAWFLYIDQESDPSYDATEGSFLADGDVDVNFFDEGPVGQIPIVVNRVDANTGATPTPENGLLVRLRFFRFTSNEDDQLEFTFATLQAPGDPEPVPIDGVEWFGGELQVD